MNNNFSDIPHINATTSIPAAMKFWQIYLADQEKSEYTIKAFLAQSRRFSETLAC
jgi:hypothetical protein